MVLARFEVAPKAIGHLTRQTHHLREGIRYAMENLEGAYAMVLASPEALYAFRDPHGIRPLCIGQLPEGRGWVVSSETCGSISSVPSTCAMWSREWCASPPRAW